MSVLRKVRGTIQNVQQDITAGLRSIGQDKQLSSGSKSTKGKNPINLNAGADLLNKYQDDWHDMHEYSEVNAHTAQVVAEQISSMSTVIMSQAAVVAKLHDEMITLPTMQQQLHTMTADLCSIEDMCHQIEVSLVQLENLCEFCELQAAKDSHRQQLVVYRESKTEQLERMRVQFAQEHADKVRKSEQILQVALKERQATFDQAFTDDVNYYKIHGFTERQPSASEEDLESTLASIVINDDTTDLDTFLDTSDTMPATSNTPASKTIPVDDSQKPPSESVTVENNEQVSETADDMNNDSENKANNEPDEGDSIYHVEDDEDEDDNDDDGEEENEDEDADDDDDKEEGKEEEKEEEDNDDGSKVSGSKVDTNTVPLAEENVLDSVSTNNETVQTLLPDKLT